MSLFQTFSRGLAAAALLAMPLIASSQDEEETPPPRDEVILYDGSRILGEVTSIRDEVLTIETKFAGTLVIGIELVQSMRTDDTVAVLMADDRLLEDVPLIVEEGRFSMGTGDVYALTDMAVTNPDPWELGDGYNWIGRINASGEIQRGNTDTDEWDYSLETQWLSLVDRYTIRWFGENDKAQGNTTVDNWNFTGKYDYFLADPNYVGFQVFAEQDDFADLDLRLLAGPYYGRLFYSEPIFTLSGELGASYVDENFIVAEDDDYMAANWQIDASSNYLGGDSRLYFRQAGVWNLEETSDVIVNTTFGLAFPLLWNFEAAAEVLYEYDSGAPDDVDDTDETYRFSFGYTW